MNLDELRTVQNKERSKDSLQHLRESFYAEVGDYIADLKEQRERAAERADDQFDDPEVNRLTDEINTAEDVVEAIYERRVGKVVKRASLAAAGMPADDEGLTSEEQELFAELVEKIESNKSEVLDVLAGESSSSATDPPAADPTPASSPEPGDAPGPAADADVSAADVMGGDAESPEPAASDGAANAGGDTPSPAAADADDETRPGPEEAAAVTGADAPDDEATPEPEPTTDEPEADADDPLAGLDERTTVRITSDVGEIFGVDERTYDLEREDVVTLPEENAGPLVERGAAEKLE